MIATHNIKVNGRWIMTGEKYGEEAPAKKAEQPAEVIPETVAESEQEAPKPKASRRKKISE